MAEARTGALVEGGEPGAEGTSVDAVSSVVDVGEADGVADHNIHSLA